MNDVRGTVRHGQISVAEKILWPDGTEVTVSPVRLIDQPLKDLSTGDIQDDDAESVARWLAEFDAIPALEMSPEEESRWQAALKQQRQLDEQKFSRATAALESPCE